MVMTNEQRLQYEIDRRKKKGMAAPKFQAKLNKLQAPATTGAPTTGTAANGAAAPMTQAQRYQYEIDRRTAKGQDAAGFKKKLAGLGTQPPVSTDPGGVTPPVTEESGLPPVVDVPGAEGTPGVTQSTQQGIANAGLNDKFNPTLTPTSTTGDLEADRARIEEEVFGRLTKNLDTNRARDKQELEQSLYNRGIGVGNPLYNQQMEEFNQRYDDLTTDARQRAAEVGGQELDRTFGMGWTQRQNEMNEGKTINDVNMGNVKDINQMSLDTFATLFDIKNRDEALALQKYIAQLQSKTQTKTANISANASKSIAAMKSGGGGGGGDTGPTFP